MLLVVVVIVCLIICLFVGEKKAWTNAVRLIASGHVVIASHVVPIVICLNAPVHTL